ncbi:hypothetical protein [uncultured Abyssibacter sp.]|uniref:DUF7151 family protein n=1 Tax=uncultured Abyssibacter sp. TaxID=2320202 RepID=UPI0032B2E39C
MLDRQRFARPACATLVGLAALGLNACSESEVDIVAFEELTVVAATIAPEDERCAFGGAIIQTGIDTNRNGTLDGDEVEAGSGQVRCNSSAPAAASPLISAFVADDGMPTAGSSTDLTVTASDSSGGSAVTYQWYDVTNDVALAESGATLNVSIPADAAPGDVFVYQVTVTDSAQVEQIRRIVLTVSERNVRPVSVVSTQSHQIFLPDGLEAPNEQPMGDFDGVVFFAGSDSIPAKSSHKMRGPRDLGGFAAQRRNFGFGNDSRQELDNLRNLVSSQAEYSLTNIATAVTRACAVGRYSMDLQTATTPTDLTRALVELIGLSADPGALSSFPNGIPDEVLAALYEFRLSVCFYSPDDVVVLVSLVVDQVKELYESVTSGVTDGTNVGASDAMREQQTDEFVGTGAGGLADFLFVIDNSGSMGDEQAALSQAASDFISVISNSGLDFQIGTITTDRQTLRGNGYTNDTAQFELDARPGTGGSGTESGIYWGERSLLSTALGDSEDGTSTLAGFPRTGASMSVVMLSDEPDQYSRYAGTAFDPSSNLFIDRSYPVYSIINEGNPGDYDDLALATGGSVASIDDITQFPAIMNAIATNAGGAASLFQLAETPISSTIVVTVDGTELVEDSTNGWQYVAGSNSIVFRGDAVPGEGAQISVSYQYIDEDGAEMR